VLIVRATQKLLLVCAPPDPAGRRVLPHAAGPVLRHIPALEAPGCLAHQRAHTACPLADNQDALLDRIDPGWTTRPAPRPVISPHFRHQAAGANWSRPEPRTSVAPRRSQTVTLGLRHVASAHRVVGRSTLLIFNGALLTCYLAAPRLRSGTRPAARAHA